AWGSVGRRWRGSKGYDPGLFSVEARSLCHPTVRPTRAKLMPKSTPERAGSTVPAGATAPRIPTRGETITSANAQRGKACAAHAPKARVLLPREKHNAATG